MTVGISEPDLQAAIRLLCVATGEEVVLKTNAGAFNRPTVCLSARPRKGSKIGAVEYLVSDDLPASRTRAKLAGNLPEALAMFEVRRANGWGCRCGTDHGGARLMPETENKKR